MKSWFKYSIIIFLISFSLVSAVGNVSIFYPHTQGTYLPPISSLNYSIDSGAYCHYSLDNGTTNSSAVTAGTNFSVSWGSGDYFLTLFCNDSSGNIATDTSSFLVKTFTDISEVQITNSSDAADGDRFGYAVSFEDDYLAVGAPREDTNGQYAGATYIFKRNSSGQFNQIQKLLPSSVVTKDEFGRRLKMDRDYLVVTAYQDIAVGQGKAYVFKKNQTTGQFYELQKITGNGSSSDARFGTEVDLDSDIMVVGAYYDDQNSLSNNGAAYVFKKNSSGYFVQTQILTANDSTSSAYFGKGVAVSNGIIAVGAFKAAGSDGKVYIFEENSSGQYEQVQSFTESTGGGRLGDSVRLFGDYLIAGASYYATYTGEAFFYKKNHTSGKFEKVQKINPSDGTSNDYFGAEVRISGDYALIGAYAKDKGAYADIGRAYLYRINNSGQFELIKSFNGTDSDGSDYFGVGMDIKKNHFMIGAYGSDHATSNAGAVYIYNLEGASLSIWDTTDSEIKYVNQTIVFYADYTSPNGSFISGANCSIHFHDGEAANMTESINIYNYTRNFTSNGTFQWQVTCVKTGETTLTENDTVQVEHPSPPYLDIISPENKTYSTINLLINISSNADLIWFTNSSGQNETYSSAVYRNFKEGDNTFYVYANTTFGYSNATNVSFHVNITTPDLVVYSPQNNSAYHNETVWINLTAYDQTLDSVWYWNGSDNIFLNYESYENISCFQEFANGTDSCGGLGGGIYYNVSGTAPLSNLYDGDWNNFTHFSWFYVNYTIPQFTNSALLNYKVATGNSANPINGTFNVSIPLSCLAENTLSLLFKGNNNPDSDFNISCYNSTGEWQNVEGKGSGSAWGWEFYEENITWQVTPHYFLCYQESANVSTACGGLANGEYYGISGPGGSVKEIYDANWTTGTINVDTFYVNYSIPSTSNGAIIQLKIENYHGNPNNGTFNLSVPSDCFYNKNLTLRYGQSYNVYNVSCMKGDGSFEKIYSFGDGVSGWNFYEESILWKVPYKYVTNITLEEGIYDWTFYANDSLNNINSTKVHFIVDLTPANVTLLDPPDNSINTTNQTNFTAYISNHVGLRNATLHIYNSSGVEVNSTYRNLTGHVNITLGVVVELPDGVYTWFYEAYDMYGAGNDSGEQTLSENWTYTIDSSPPNITVYSPINSTKYNSSTILINLSVDDFTTDTVWYWNGSDNKTLSMANDSVSWCYQESANVSTACGGVGSGYYLTDQLNGTLINRSSWFDENYDTYSEVAHNCSSDSDGETIYYINYSIPQNALNSSVWQIKVNDSTGKQNISLDGFGCSFNSTLQLRLHSFVNRFGCPGVFGVYVGWTKAECYDGSTWVLLHTFDEIKNYEEAMWWKIQSSNQDYYISNETVEDGDYAWSFYANDSTGSNSSAGPIYFSVDSHAPNLTIHSPVSTTYNTTQVVVNLSYSDVHLDTVWFTNLSGQNQTYNGVVNISVGNGNYLFEAWANDSFGNIIEQNVSFSVANTAITACGELAVEGVNYTLFQDISSTGTCMNITGNDIELDCDGHVISFGSGSVGYGVNIEANNTKLKNCIIESDSSFDGAAINIVTGNFSLFSNNTMNMSTPSTIWINGSSSFQSTDAVFISDLGEIHFPLFNYSSAVNKSTMSINERSAYLDSSKLSGFNTTAYLYFKTDYSRGRSLFVDEDDDGVIDYPCPSSVCNYTSGPVPLIVRVSHFTNYTLNDSAGNVTLISPANGTGAGFAPTIQCSFETYNPYVYAVNLTLYLDGEPIYSVTNSSENQTSLNLSHTIYINSPNASYEWNCLGENNYHNATFATSNWTFNVININNVSYNTSTFETDLQYFTISWTAANTSLASSAHLIYNGTTYIASQDNIVQNGANFTATVALDIPLLSSETTQNMSFYWEIRMAEKAAYPIIYSDVYNQTVSPVLFNNCSGIATYPILNVSTYGEEFRMPLEVDYYRGYFQYWMGNGSVYKIFNHSLTNFNSTLYCVNNDTRNYHFWNSYEVQSEGLGTIDDNNRLYIFPRETYNASSIFYRKLYMLNESVGISVKVIAQIGSTLIDGAEVKIYRYYPELAEPLLVHNGQTGSFGYWVSKLIENEVEYLIKIYKPNGELIKSYRTKIFCATGEECKIEGNKPMSEEIKNELLSELKDRDQILYYDDSTRTFFYALEDSSNKQANFTLKVYHVSFMENDTLICESSGVVNSQTGTNNKSLSLNCTIPENMTGQFYASVFIRTLEGALSDKDYVLLINKKHRLYIEIEEENLYENETLFISFIMLFTMVAIGAFSPVAGIVFFLAGYIGLGLMGIISLNLVLFFGTLIIGIVFIVALSRREKA